MTKHSDLSGADLHEPKGAATATSGQVYVADGAGSGSWTDLTAATTVDVTSVSDFPSPVAGVITLAANTTYTVYGDVDLGSRSLVFSESTVLRGISHEGDSITSSTTGVFLTMTDVNCLIKDIGISASNASALWDIDGTGTEKVEIENVNVAAADVLGDIDNLDVFRLSYCTITTLTTNGMTFTGAFDDLHIHEVQAKSFTGTLIDLQTATFNRIVISDCYAVLGTGDVWLDAAPSGANLNAAKEGFLLGNDIDVSAGGTATVGFAISDTKWTSGLNYGVGSSARNAQGYAENNATATTFTGTGSGNEVVMNVSTNFVSDIAQGFTVSTGGRLTYDGLTPLNFYVNANIFASITGGAARTYNFYIAKNGTIVASSVSQQEFDGTNPGTLSVSSLVTLTTSDYVEVYIRAETATTSLTVDTISLKAVEV